MNTSHLLLDDDDDESFNTNLVTEYSSKNNCKNIPSWLIKKSHEEKNNRIPYEYSSLDEDGIVGVGCSVEKNQIVIDKATVKSNNSMSLKTNRVFCSSTPIKHISREKMYVEKVLLSNFAKSSLLYKVDLSQMRVPEIGDKVTSKHSQKGIIGMIYNEEDMPFTDTGICPDIIINPHGFPSRQTFGQLLELLSSKGQSLKYTSNKKNTFDKTPLQDIQNILIENGYNYKVRMYFLVFNYIL